MRRTVWLGVVVALHMLLAHTDAESKYYPLVFMHGVTATSKSMEHAAALAQELMPGIFTYSIKIGNDTDSDSVFIPMPEQVAQMGPQLRALPELADGFSLFCVSQGGANCRGYIEMDNNPPVVNYVSWVAVEGGVSGVPDCGVFNDLIVHLLTTVPYAREVQDHVAPADYWRDPFHLDTYAAKSIFLPLLNNNPAASAPPNPAYKARFSSLASLVLLYSEVDTVLVPRQTGWFATFAPNSYSDLVHVNQSALWKDDWIGLRSLDEAGKVVWGTTTCEHQDYSSPCFDRYFRKWVLPVVSKPRL